MESIADCDKLLNWHDRVLRLGISPTPLGIDTSWLWLQLKYVKLERLLISTGNEVSWLLLTSTYFKLTKSIIILLIVRNYISTKSIQCN